MKKVFLFSIISIGAINAVEHTLPETEAVEKATRPFKKVAPQYSSNWEAVKQESKRLANQWFGYPSEAEKEKAANAEAVTAKDCNFSADPDCE